MALLLSAFAVSFADGCILPYLDLSDLVRAEALSRSAQETLLCCCALWHCARRNLPRFKLGSALAATPLDQGCRPLVAALRRATVVSLRGALPLPDLSAVQALVSALNRANAAAAEHLAMGGCFAHVFVARFRFPHLSAGAANAGPFAAAGGPVGMPALMSAAARDGMGPGVGPWPPHVTGPGAVVAGPLLGAGGIRVVSWPGLYPSEPVPLPLCRSSSLAGGPGGADLRGKGTEATPVAVPSASEPEQTEQRQQPQQQQLLRRSRRRGDQYRHRHGDASNAAFELRLAWFRDSILVNVQSREKALGRQRLVRAAAAGMGVAAVPTPATAGVAEPRAARGAGGGGSSSNTSRTNTSLGSTSVANGPSDSGGCTRFSLDIRSVSSELFLSTRGLQVDVDSGWLKGHGVCSVMKDRNAAARAMAEGLLCVVCFRDAIAAAEGSTSSQIPSNVHALHLEVSRLHGAWH